MRFHGYPTLTWFIVSCVFWFILRMSFYQVAYMIFLWLTQKKSFRLCPIVPHGLLFWASKDGSSAVREGANIMENRRYGAKIHQINFNLITCWSAKWARRLHGLWGSVMYVPYGKTNTAIQWRLKRWITAANGQSNLLHRAEPRQTIQAKRSHKQLNTLG